ncbi:MAG: hypothetical protein ACRD1K_07895 [Acidimicrobiales bacterium]
MAVAAGRPLAFVAGAAVARDRPQLDPWMTVFRPGSLHSSVPGPAPAAAFDC